LGEHRPGQQAAEQKGAEFPLVAAGLSKAEIRELSQAMGLRTWNKPAAACLASRVPYGTAVTVGLLSTIDRAEAALRQLGFAGNMRVRHEGKTARIELDTSDFARAAEMHQDIVEALAPLGYQYITLDLAGFRSGNLNWALEVQKS
ncbi:MAG: TIGR00268 family protein, partial [Actinomycetes bacterium]